MEQNLTIMKTVVTINGIEQLEEGEIDMTYLQHVETEISRLGCELVDRFCVDKNCRVENGGDWTSHLETMIARLWLVRNDMTGNTEMSRFF